MDWRTRWSSTEDEKNALHKARFAAECFRSAQTLDDARMHRAGQGGHNLGSTAGQKSLIARSPESFSAFVAMCTVCGGMSAPRR